MTHLPIRILRQILSRNRWCLFLALALAGGVGWLGIGEVVAAPGQITVPEKTVTFRIRDEPETLDWNRAHTVVEADILMNLMEGLVTFDSSMNVSYALASGCDVTDGGKVYTFHIKPGIQWSDDRPLKAQDFVYSWRRLLSPITAAPYAYLLFDVQGAEAFNKGTLTSFEQVGIKAIDDLTFQVTLIQPVAHWLYIPAFWATFPVRQDIVEAYGSGWEAPGRMVTVGPYTLLSHDLNSKIVLRANPKYYGAHGNVSLITALILKDDAAALAQYEEGKLDFLTDVATVDLKSFARRPDFKVFPQLKTGYLGFVTEKYPLSNVKFRRAIAMAIDKSKIGQVMGGNQQPATSFVPPPLMASGPRVGLPFDPVKARAELAASGLTISKTMTLNYLLPNWDKSVALGEWLKAELKRNLNIDVVLKSMDNKTYRAQLGMKNYPLFDYTWTADYPDSDNFLSVFLSDSGNSQTAWKNSKFDEAVRLARRTQNRAERESLYLATQKILLEEEAVLVPLYYEPSIALVRPRIRNVEIDPMGYLFLRKVSVAP